MEHSNHLPTPLNQWGMIVQNHMETFLPNQSQSLIEKGTWMPTLLAFQEQIEDRMETLMTLLMTLHQAPETEAYQEHAAHHQRIRLQAQEMVLAEVLPEPEE